MHGDTLRPNGGANACFERVTSRCVRVDSRAMQAANPSYHVHGHRYKLRQSLARVSKIPGLRLGPCDSVAWRNGLGRPVFDWLVAKYAFQDFAQRSRLPTNARRNVSEASSSVVDVEAFLQPHPVVHGSRTCQARRPSTRSLLFNPNSIVSIDYGTAGCASPQCTVGHSGRAFSMHSSRT